jgi:AraC-like DNA-binding protein
LHFAPRACAVFHVLYRGDGYLQLAGEKAVLALKQGDVVLLPNGDEHLLLEAQDAPVFRNLQLDQWGECAIMRWSEQPAAVVLCGTFDFEHVETFSLFKHLPRVVHIQHNVGSGLNSVLALMAAEAEAERPAKEVVLRRLADILFIQIIQHWVETRGVEHAGWLGALQDRAIGESLALMHSQPDRPWTVAELADAVKYSRSSFAARFTALVGEPPMEYLTRWRLQLAIRLLKEQPALPISAVASSVGYSSEAAFSRAFKRKLGVAPSSYRRQTTQRRLTHTTVSRTASLTTG